MKRSAFPILLLILTILCFSAGCKQDPCNDIWCLNDGTCIDGTCNCQPGFSGERCEVQDLCYEVDCQNGGQCMDGVCDCVIGWEGTNCETLARLKFLGTFPVTQSCDQDTLLYNCTISAPGNPVQEILFDDFHNLFSIYGISDFVKADVNGNGIIIPPQIMNGNGNSVSLSGSGAYTATSININYTITINGASQLVCRQVYSL